MKAKDPYKALINYRNTRLEEINLPPAQLMMGRRLKTTPNYGATFEISSRGRSLTNAEETKEEKKAVLRQVHRKRVITTPARRENSDATRREMDPSSGVASFDNWRGEYSYICVHRP